MNIAIFVIALVAGTMFGVGVHKVGIEPDNGGGWGWILLSVILMIICGLCIGG